MTRRTSGRLVLALLLLLAVGVILGELSEATAQAADLSLVREVAKDRVGSLTVVAHGLSWLGRGYVIGPLALACCAALSRRGRRASALAVAVSVIGAFAISSLDKLLVGRPRPPVLHLETVSSASFPSGHATDATAFVLALLIAFLLTKPRRPQLFTAVIATIALSSGVALSRVYLGVHYPRDVLAGVLIGAAWSVIVAWLLLGHKHARDDEGHIDVEGHMNPARVPKRPRGVLAHCRSQPRGSVASRSADAMFVGLTRAADRSLLWLAIAGILALAGGQRGKRAAARGLVAISLASAVTNGPLKLAFHRPRPIRRPLLIRRPRSFSFPSGHSALAFAFATAGSAQLPAAAPLLLPLAAGVAYSRVRVGVHRPSDVLLGSALGSASGVIVSSAGRPRSRPAKARSQSEPPDLPTELVLVTSPHAGGSRGIDAAREELRRLGFSIAEQLEIDQIDRLPDLIRSTDTPPTLVVAAGGEPSEQSPTSSRTATAFSPCCRSAPPTTSHARSESP